MGIKLMVEILDHWQDAGLTVGERSDLLVLAENANDGTRLTFGPVHAPYILRRAGKTANGWKNAVGKLVAKKVLTVHTPGRIKQAAVYRLERLCPESRHDGYKGHCVRPPKEERVTSEVTHPEKEGHPAGDPMGHPSGDPLGQEGHLAGAERVTSQVTPTPPYPSFKTPSTTSSTSPVEPPVDVSQSAPEVTDGGGGDISLRETAIHIAASLDYQGKPPTRKQRQLIEDRLLVFLDAGWTMEDLVIHLDLTGQVIRYAPAVYIDRLDPVELSGRRPSLAAPAPSRGGALGRVATAEEIRAATVESVFFGEAQPSVEPRTWAEAQANVQRRMSSPVSGGGTDANMAAHFALRDQLARQEHKPYSNPRDDSIYDEPWTYPAPPKPAWCGEPECSETDRMRDDEDDGLPVVRKCPKCHPDRPRAAA